MNRNHLLIAVLIISAILAATAAWWLGNQPVRITVDLYPEAPTAALAVIPDEGDRRLLHYHAIQHPALPGARLRVDVTARATEPRTFFAALEYKRKSESDPIRIERFHPGAGDTRTISIDRLLPEDLLPGSAALYLGIDRGTRPVPVVNIAARIQSPPWPTFAGGDEPVDVLLPLAEWRAEPKHLGTIPDNNDSRALPALVWKNGTTTMDAVTANVPKFHECEVHALPWRITPGRSYVPAATHTYLSLHAPPRDDVNEAWNLGDPHNWIRPSWGNEKILASRFQHANAKWEGWCLETPRIRFLKRIDGGITRFRNGNELGVLDLHADEGEEWIYLDLEPTRTARRYETTIPRSALAGVHINDTGVLAATIHTWYPQYLYAGPAFDAPQWARIGEFTEFDDGKIPSTLPWEHGGPTTAILLFAIMALVSGGLLVGPFSKRP